MQQSQQKELVQKSFLVTAIVVFIILMVLLLVFAIKVWLLVFAGLLVATFLNGLSGLLQRKTKWKAWICKTLAVLLTIAAVGGMIWLMGAKVAAEARLLSEEVPKMLKQLEQRMQSSPIGKKVVELVKNGSSSKNASSVGSRFFSTTFGIMGDLFSVFFLAMFFTVQPDMYKKGIVMLLPPGAKQKGESVLDKTGNALRTWLKGTLFSMFVVFVLTSLGLVSLGVKLWFMLALIAGFLNAIPNFGPLISMIPAVLMNMGESTTTIGLIIGLYMLVQFLESNIITPWIQHKLLEVPAAGIMIIQLLMGALTGAWGLILATPLLVVLMIVIEELYISRQPATTGAGTKKKKDED